MNNEAIEISKQIVFGGADIDLLHTNANKASERVPVMKNMVAGEVAKHVGKQMLPEEVFLNHENGAIHFHDLDESPFYPMYNCCLVNLEDMLTNGFTMGNAQIESPNGIETACAITSQIIAQVSSHQYGGVSLNRLDEVLAPYVALTYDKEFSEALADVGDAHKAVAIATRRTKKAVTNACQSMEYEINTIFTSQGQTPFVTFGFGLGTSWQSKLIQEGILEQRIKGLGKQRRTAIFPKLVYMVDEGINASPRDPNYHDIRKLAIKCASLRNYPDVLNMPILRRNNGGCAPMGCRSFLHEWVNPKTHQLEWEGRCNLGVVSINIPRIAIEAKYDVDQFYKILDERLAITKTALDYRVDRLRGVKANVAPILYCEGAIGRLNPDDDIFQLFDNQRSSCSVGYIGLHETAQALFGNDTIPFKDSNKHQFMINVVSTIKIKINEWNDTSDIAFGLYGTPSESLCYRFLKKDREEFGVIEGVTDKEYYTNSFHLDVKQSASPFTKFDFESVFNQHSSSGNITYAEIPNVEMHYRELMIDELWKYAYDIIPYHGQNCAIDKCHECGYLGDIEMDGGNFVCPHCGTTDNLEITKRVCGYLGTPDKRGFNTGKQDEVNNRVKHK